MKALIQWIQIGNWFSTSYKQNASTDTATVVGGVSISAAVFAVLYTLSQVKPDLNISAELITTVTALVGGTASQIVPWIKHWFDERNAKRSAEAKERVDGSAFAERIKQEQLAPSEPTDEAPVDPSVDMNCTAVSWVDSEGKRRAITPTSKKPKTLAVLISVHEAVEVVLADGRVWRKS